MSERYQRSKNKKQEQLGMNPSTASGRLTKDILFKLVVEAGYVCHQCSRELTRGTFSVEHKEPWLDSENPVSLYFDLENIAFSHLSCNISAGRKRHQVCFSEEERRERNNILQKKWYHNKTPEENKERRRKEYLKYGQ